VKEDVDVLVGGSTHNPKVQQLYFGKEPSKDINSDEAVAYGAILAGDEGTNDIMMALINVNPLTLAIETAAGVFMKLILRNPIIPVKCE